MSGDYCCRCEQWDLSDDVAKLKAENDKLKQHLRDEGDRIMQLREALTTLAAVARRYLPDYDEHSAIQLADDVLDRAGANTSVSQGG